MVARVLILYTGGTIGMCASPDGYRPMGGFGAVLQQTLRDGTGVGMPPSKSSNSMP